VSSVNGATLNPPYAICDPRKLQLLQQQLGVLGASGGAAAGAGTTAGLNAAIAAGIVRSGSRQGSHDEGPDFGGYGAAGGEGNAGTVAYVAPPKHYLRQSSLLTGSKQRFKKFDYTTVNVSCNCVSLPQQMRYIYASSIAFTALIHRLDSC
jgi:hypothetical protein